MRLLCLAALALAGCSSNDGPSPTPTPAPSATGGLAGCHGDADCPGLKCDVATGQCVSPSAIATKEGDPCTVTSGMKCGADGAVFYCENDKYTKVFSCPPLQTCKAYTDAVICGEGDLAPAYSKEGGPCATERAGTCTFDKTGVNECLDGVWTTTVHCPPSNCIHTADNHHQCANGGYTVGDRCTSSANGALACSTDLTKILSCANGTMVVNQDCAGKKCTLVQGPALVCR